MYQTNETEIDHDEHHIHIDPEGRSSGTWNGWRRHSEFDQTT